MAALNLCPPVRPFRRHPDDGGVLPPPPGSALPVLYTTSLLGLLLSAVDGGGGDQILLPTAFSRRGVVCLVTCIRTAPVATSRSSCPPPTPLLRGFGCWLILTRTAPVSTSLCFFACGLLLAFSALLGGAGDRRPVQLDCPLRYGVALLPVVTTLAFVRFAGLVAVVGSSAPTPS